MQLNSLEDEGDSTTEGVALVTTLASLDRSEDKVVRAASIIKEHELTLPLAAASAAPLTSLGVFGWDLGESISEPEVRSTCSVCIGVPSSWASDGTCFGLQRAHVGLPSSEVSPGVRLEQSLNTPWQWLPQTLHLWPVLPIPQTQQASCGRVVGAMV